MGSKKNKFLKLKYSWKKWKSIVGSIALLVIIFQFFMFAYQYIGIGIVNKLDDKHTFEIKYDQIMSAFKSKDNRTLGNSYTESKNKVINDIEFEDLNTTLRRISQNYQYTVLVSVINRGYINLTYNWLCNTRKWNIHNRVLFIVFDKETKLALKMDWPEVTSIYYRGMDETSGYAYATVGYARIVLKRVEVMLKIIQNDVKMFLFETDSVWFRNPLPYLNRVTQRYDIAITKMSTLDLGDVGYCICFLYIYPTRVMKRFWDKMFQNMTLELQRLQSLKATSRVQHYPLFSMQKVFSKLINSKYSDVNFLILPSKLFPDGFDYMEKSKLVGKQHAFLLHNNYIAGNNRKIQRAKEAGHWFLEDDMTCKN